jgi:magnesium and cobalt transporter
MAKDQTRQGIFEGIFNLFKKLLSRSSPEDLTNELQELIDEGEAKGLISEEESDMVMSVLDLKDTRAYSIMVPRIQVIAASVASSIKEILELINTHGFTRIPIYQGSLDEIIGILHAKDLLKLWGQDLQDRLPKELLRPPFFAPHNIRIMDLLKELRQNKMHMAVLTDEYGGTVGIVTIEDILEEIVGEIQDEYDKEEQLIIEHSDGSFLVDGRMDAEEFAERIGISLPEGDFESMAGLIINLHGKIPKQGEVIFYEGYEFIIEKVDMRKIYKILVKKTNNLQGEDQTQS